MTAGGKHDPLAVMIWQRVLKAWRSEAGSDTELFGDRLFTTVKLHDPKKPTGRNAALRGMGYAKEVMTAHGFRAMARTIMDEVLGERPDLIEHQLAHAVKDPNGRAYNRTAHLPARRAMMQRWADYLDELAQGTKVIPFAAT
jgi:integrase